MQYHSKPYLIFLFWQYYQTLKTVQRGSCMAHVTMITNIIYSVWITTQRTALSITLANFGCLKYDLQSCATSTLAYDHIISSNNQVTSS